MLFQSSPYRIVVFFVVTDLIGLIASFYLAFALRFENRYPDLNSSIFWVVLLTYFIVFYGLDVYRIKVTDDRPYSSKKVFVSIVITVWLLTSVIYFFGLWKLDAIVGRGILLLSSSLFTCWALGYRYIINLSKTNKRKKTKHWLVLGDRNKLLKFVSDNRSFDINNLFYMKSFVNNAAGDYFVNLLNSNDQEQKGVVFRKSWTGILIDDSMRNIPEHLFSDLVNARISGREIYRFGDFCEQYLQKIPPEMIHPSWFVFSDGFGIVSGHIYSRFKRLGDLLFASFLLVLTLPLMVIVALAITINSPGPILYSQIRKGLSGKEYKIYKFRSMFINAEKMGVKWAEVGDKRITRVGRIIRKMRIDELPQLWNIFAGDMSLIGPRPERPEFDSDLIDKIPYYDFRYLVKPGVTGWSQVKFGYGNTLEDSFNKVAYDLYYIKNYSFFLDLLIVLKTIRVVLFAQGI